MVSNSPGLNSGGGNKNGISLVWFYTNGDFVIRYLKCRNMPYLDTEQPIPSSNIHQQLNVLICVWRTSL